MVVVYMSCLGGMTSDSNRKMLTFWEYPCIAPRNASQVYQSPGLPFCQLFLGHGNFRLYSHAIFDAPFHAQLACYYTVSPIRPGHNSGANYVLSDRNVNPVTDRLHLCYL